MRIARFAWSFHSGLGPFVGLSPGRSKNVYRLFGLDILSQIPSDRPSCGGVIDALAIWSGRHPVAIPRTFSDGQSGDVVKHADTPLSPSKA